MLEEVKNAKNIKKLQTQGHPKFSHILKKFYITFYNLHAYYRYFRNSSWLRNYI